MPRRSTVTARAAAALVAVLAVALVLGAPVADIGSRPGSGVDPAAYAVGPGVVAAPAGGTLSAERTVRTCRKKKPRRQCRKPRKRQPVVRPARPTPTAAPTASPTAGPTAVPTAVPPATPAPVDGPMRWTLLRSANPSADELDAYERITRAMDAAVARYNRNATFHRHLYVAYAPWVPTAEGGGNDIRFGANRGFMTERTALHEIGHTVGVGMSGGWYAGCNGNGSGQWTGPVANALIKSWDGPGAVINCGGRHVWPYGLNYDNEFSERDADRHVQLMAALVRDGQ